MHCHMYYWLSLFLVLPLGVIEVAGSCTGTELVVDSGTVSVSFSDETGKHVTLDVTEVPNSVFEKVTIEVSITHGWPADVYMTITSPAPSSASSVLFDNEDYDGDPDFENTVFDWDAATWINSGSGPWTGSYRPKDTVNPYTSTSMADGYGGTWDLYLQDYYADSDPGTLTNWKLRFTYSCPQTETPTLTELTCGPYQTLIGTGPTNIPFTSSSTVDVEFVIPTNLAENAITTDVVVVMDVVHPNVRDVQISLIAPDATTVVVFDDGVAAVNSANITSTFTDAALFKIDGTSTAPFTGMWRPFAALSFLDAKSIPGTWKARFAITNPGGSDGYVSDLSLQFAYSCEPADCVPATDKVYLAVDQLQSAFPASATTIYPLTIGCHSCNQTLDSIKVQLSLSHSNPGELSIRLVNPAGQSTPLSHYRGTTGAGFTNTIFDDAAPTAIGSGSTPFTGSFRPDGNLWYFQYEPLMGTWQLEVINDGPSSGQVTAWSLMATYSCGPPPTKTLIPTETPSSTPTSIPTYTPTEVPTITPTTSSTPTPTPTLTPTSTLTEIPTMTDTPSMTPGPDRILCGPQNVSIHQKGLSVSFDSGSSGSQSVGITGIYSNLAVVRGVKVGFSITHEDANDVEVRLKSPAGTEVVLLESGGLTDINSNSRQDFVETFFEDGVSTALDGTQTAPFTGTFEPADAQGLAKFYSQSVGGAWQLMLLDHGTLTGTLTEWWLEIDFVCPTAASIPCDADGTHSHQAYSDLSHTVTDTQTYGLTLACYPCDAWIKEISVTLTEVVHQRVNDLELVLETPGGDVTLFDQIGHLSDTADPPPYNVFTNARFSDEGTGAPLTLQSSGPIWTHTYVYTPADGEFNHSYGYQPSYAYNLRYTDHNPANSKDGFVGGWYITTTWGCPTRTATPTETPTPTPSLTPTATLSTTFTPTAVPTIDPRFRYSLIECDSGETPPTVTKVGFNATVCRIMVRDVYGPSVASEGHFVIDSVGAGDISSEHYSTDGGSTFVFNFTATELGTATIRVFTTSGDELPNSPYNFSIVGDPTSASTISCDSGRQPSTNVWINPATCTLTVNDGNQAVASDFLISTTKSPNGGTIGTITTNDDGRTFQIPYNPPAGPPGGAEQVQVLLAANPSPHLTGSPFDLTLVEDPDLALTTLACDSGRVPPSAVESSGTTLCTITVRDGDGDLAPSVAEMFSVAVGGAGSVDTPAPTDAVGNMFQFTYTAVSGTYSDSITVQVGGTDVQGSPFALSIQAFPTEASELTCMTQYQPPQNVPRTLTANCTIVVKDVGGAPIKGFAEQFLYSTTLGSLGPATSPDDGYTFEFVYYADSSAGDASIDVLLNETNMAITGSPSQLVVVEAPDTSSSLACTSEYYPTITIPIYGNGQALCTITAISSSPTSSYYYTINTPSVGTIANLVSDIGFLFNFTYTATTPGTASIEVEFSALQITNSPLTLYATDIATDDSVLTCTSGLNPSSNVRVTETVNCNLVPHNTGGAIRAALDEFAISHTPSIGTLSVPTTSDSGLTYTWDLTASATIGSGYIETKTRANENVDSSPSPIYAVDFPNATIATLTCASAEEPSMNLPVNSTAMCTLVVGDGFRAVAEDFSISNTNGRGSLSPPTTTDSGLSFTWTLSSDVGGTGPTEVQVMVGADHVQGSPFALYVTEAPDSSSTLECNSGNEPQHNVKPDKIITCNITARNGGAIRTVASYFTSTFSPSIGSMGAITSTDEGYTFQYEWKAPVIPSLVTAHSLAANGLALAQGPIGFFVTGTPGFSSSVSCNSGLNPTINVRRGGIAYCTVTSMTYTTGPIPVRAIASDFVASLDNTLLGDLGTLTSLDDGLTFDFTFTANTSEWGAVGVNLLLTSDDTHIAASPFALYVTDVPTTSTVLDCTSGYVPPHNVPPGRTATCTIYVKNDAGSIRAVGQDFEVNNTNILAGTLSGLTTFDNGQTFTFTFTHANPGILNVQVTLGPNMLNFSGDVSGSPLELRATGNPDTNSMLDCTSGNIPPHNVRTNPAETVLCTITVSDPSGVNKGLAIHFHTVLIGVGTISDLTTPDGGSTFEFTYTADGGVATVDLSVYVNYVDHLVGSPVQLIAIKPPGPTSSLVCQSTYNPPTNLPMGNTADCVITIRDEEGNPTHGIAGDFSLESDNLGAGHLATPTTTDNGMTLVYAWHGTSPGTSNFDANLTSSEIPLVGSPEVYHVTSAPLDTSVLVCQSRHYPIPHVPAYESAVCTINVTTADGLNRAVASDFTVSIQSGSVGSIGEVQTYDEGSTFVFAYAASTDPGLANIHSQLTVGSSHLDGSPFELQATGQCGTYSYDGVGKLSTCVVAEWPSHVVYPVQYRQPWDIIVPMEATETLTSISFKFTASYSLFSGGPKTLTLSLEGIPLGGVDVDMAMGQDFKGEEFIQTYLVADYPGLAAALAGQSQMKLTVSCSSFGRYINLHNLLQVDRVYA